MSMANEWLWEETPYLYNECTMLFYMDTLASLAHTSG